jgi:hypothetical protein
MNDNSIANIFKESPEQGCIIESSPFSNNLGFSIAIIDTSREIIYFTHRHSEDVSVHAGKKSTGVGSQLHAFDDKHKKSDGRPDIFGAAYAEIENEAGLSRSDIADLFIAGWGIGLRTGTPELLFICVSKKPLNEIADNVVDAKVMHASEFDKVKMHGQQNTLLDYQLLADIQENHDEWEPESAVATCLAADYLIKGCVDHGIIQ